MSAMAMRRGHGRTSGAKARNRWETLVVPIRLPSLYSGRSGQVINQSRALPKSAFTLKPKEARVRIRQQTSMNGPSAYMFVIHPDARRTFDAAIQEIANLVVLRKPAQQGTPDFIPDVYTSFHLTSEHL